MQEMVQYYETLEIGFGASPDEIKSAYRDMVNVWHPDRFGSNQRLKERAEEKLKIINAAYEKLKGYKPSEAELNAFKEPRNNSVNDASNDVQASSSVGSEVKPKQSGLMKFGKFCLYGIGFLWWLGIMGKSPATGLVIGAIAVGGYFWKKKSCLASATTTNKEKAAAKSIDKSEARKLLIENLLILALCDGNSADEEISLIIDIAKKYWPNDDSGELIKMSYSNIQKANDVKARFEQNTKTLSKLLDKKEKLEALALAEMLVKADGTVTGTERALYAIFKGLLKASGIGSSILNTFSDKCPVCKSTRVELIKAIETDRWRGTKNVSEKLASGKYKTRTVQTTFVNIRRIYNCDECVHDWATDTKEEK
jgi:hypothetical protein